MTQHTPEPFSMAQAMKRIDQLTSELSALRTQRDALLEALKVVEWAGSAMSRCSRSDPLSRAERPGGGL